MVVATFTQMMWKLIEIIFVWVYIPLIINDNAINIIYLKRVEDFFPFLHVQIIWFTGGFHELTQSKYKFIVIINVVKCENTFITEPEKPISTSLCILKFILCEFSAIFMHFPIDEII